MASFFVFFLECSCAPILQILWPEAGHTVSGEPFNIPAGHKIDHKGFPTDDKRQILF